MAAQLHDAEIRRERRERIVADLRAGGRNHGEKRGFARIRLPDESDVGDEFELELDRPPLPFFSWLPFARRLVSGRREKGVPLPAAPALGDDDRLPLFEHFAEQLTALQIADDGAERHRQDDVDARLARLVRSLAVLSSLGLPGISIRVIEQRGEIWIAPDEYIAP